MLSRVAERMYWAGRYLERVEATARLINVQSGMLLDLPTASDASWEQLLVIAEVNDQFFQRHSHANEESVLHFLLADAENTSSLIASLAFARENIRTCRDIVPSEAWECVNELYLLCQQNVADAVNSEHRHESLSEYVVRCQLLTGLLFGTMSHGSAYHFLRTGAYIERADMTARVVKVAATTLVEASAELKPLENTLWMGVLKSVSGYQMYRQYVRRRITGADVVGFLLSDPQFPHAVHSALRELATHLNRLPKPEQTNDVIAALIQALEQFCQEVHTDERLQQFIESLELGLIDLHHRVEDSWFLKPQAVD